jgi:glycosyltransferase involved in cell wall biosynthesis
MRILFVSSIIPWPPNVGTILRSLSLIEALERLGNVDYLFFSNSRSITSSPFAINRNILDVLPPPKFLPWLFWDKIARLIGQANNEWLPYYVPGFFKHYYSKKSPANRLKSLNNNNYDIIFVVQMDALWWLGSFKPNKTILDVDVIKHIGVETNPAKSASYVKKLAKRLIYRNLRDAEIKTITGISAALVCSKDDLKLIPTNNVHIVPNIYPDHGQIACDTYISKSKIILFVGTLTYKSNRTGLEHFIKRILPLILKNEPNAILRVVGRTDANANYEWTKDVGVDFIGTVPDPKPYIEEAAIEICPVLDGLGTRIKIIEALSYGKPIVSTTIGAYGIDLNENDGLYRVDTDEETAKLCLQLLNNHELRKDIGKKAKLAVKNMYSQVVVNNEIERIVNDILRSN